MKAGQTIFDLFPGINVDDDIKMYFSEGIISSINIYNKQKKIELLLECKELIPKSAVFLIRDQIRSICNIEHIDIKIKYTNVGESPQDILENYWTSIITYINNNVPISKGILNNSNWMVSYDRLNISLQNCGSDLLKSKGCDKAIENLLREELGIKLKVEFINPLLSKEEEEYYEEVRNSEELQIIKEMLSSNQNNDTLPKDDKKNSIVSKKDTDYESNIILGKPFKGELTDIIGLNDQSGKVVVEGDIITVGSRETSSGKYLFTFDITDYKSTISGKFFTEKKNFEKINQNLKEGIRARIQGEVIFDKYSREVVIMTSNIIKTEKKVRLDNCEQKRVELHLHTKMSAMDGVSSAADLVKTAALWGHKAIAITDHGVAQAYPEAHDAGKKHNIKIIYGVECYLLDDNVEIVTNMDDKSLDDSFVVFDIETTGLQSKKDRITEIGAVKVCKGEIIDTYNTFINPEVPIPTKITELTGITDDMVKNAPTIEEELPKFLEFVGDCIFVAHNADFDMGFIKHNAKKLNIELKNPILDTLELSRALLPQLKKHKLNIICEHLGVSLENHHRAVDDAKATAEVFIKFIEMLKERNIFTISDINEKLSGMKNFTKMDSYHAVVLVKNYTGLRNLYELISESHLKYFYKKPRIQKTLFNKYKEGLLIGTACEAGELYRYILNNKDDEEIYSIVKYYDYLEIQPLDNNMFLVNSQKVESIEKLKDINKKIVELGEKFGKPVVATCDVHYLNPEDEVFRRILMAGQGYEDADNQSNLYFRTTAEMLEEFSYLGKEKAFEVVVKAPNDIAEMIENIKPIPDETFPPKIEGAEQELEKLTLQKAKDIYGNILPDIVKERIDKELNSIIKNGFAVMYIIAQKLVSKSLQDGYLVGSRGSVGSSMVAYLSGITEVNSLPPHYVCPNCKYSEFITDGSIGSGFDLPDKNCPSCDSKLYGDGQDIPFETFLGFDGDKEPDIDLNFSGDYQSTAHKYTEELFGEGYVYRAGTIGTIAEKTAYGFVKKYLEERGMIVNNAEVNRLVKGCTGVKRTTGQHPGGVMIVPKGKSIFEFCPIQRPADDTGSNTITTHFDYHSISGRLLKLDILGHDDPTVIRMLEDLTGVNARNIRIGDKQVMKLFTTTDVMGIKPEDINSEVGSFGIPEFGTKFVRQMLIDTKPTTFAELVRISGLSHGTDVWLNNAQDIVRNGTAKLSEVICTRDDIMVYLIYKGLPPKAAFKIMESVRKGKGLKEEDEKLMRDNSVPEWYIQSCKKIKYMFPKAHASAYVMMAFRIAYFKLYYPEAFYVTYFTVRADDFDAKLMIHGTGRVREKIRELEQKGNTISTKEKNVLTILEVANEMYSRGIEFLPIDIYQSDAQKFIITPKGILPPLNALQGLGLAAAQNMIKAREEGAFMSKDDLRIRAKVSKTVIEILEENGCLKDLPESNQISLFG